jgi:phosphatidate cytidylyltransferase
VAGVDPVNQRVPLLSAPTGRQRLLLRVVSSIVMIPLALGAAYLGDLVFVAFWAIAALGVLWEWDAMVCAHDKNPVLTIGSVAIVGATVLWAINRPIPTLILIGLGMLGIASLASKVRRVWCVAGLAYAGALLLAPLVLRHDPTFGFWAIVFVFGVVWATDIGAYVAGRGLGGPKLIPQISPNKTWIGAIGGLVAGAAGGIVVAKLAAIENVASLSVVALALSAVSQFGDILESAVKRRFHAKDSSWLIPGHGGLMDRLDGFITAVIVACMIGIARSGVDDPGRGLLVW